MSLESFLIIKKRCCQRVARTCGVDRLYWFSLKAPVQVLKSQTRVPIKSMQRLASPSAVESCLFGFQASCCTRFSKCQQIPAVQKPNDLSRTIQIPAVSNQIPAVQKPNDLSRTIQIPAVSNQIPAVQKPNDLSRTIQIPAVSNQIPAVQKPNDLSRTIQIPAVSNQIPAVQKWA